MKKFYHAFFLILAMVLISTSLTSPTYAATGVAEPQIIMLEDGAYIVVTIEYDQPLEGPTLFASRSLKSGTKTYSGYENSDELVWEFRVHGSFTYNGVTSSATGVSYSYDIYDTKWSFVDGTASYSGATATATGRFRRALFPNAVTLTLTCSPTGVLS